MIDNELDWKDEIGGKKENALSQRPEVKKAKDQNFTQWINELYQKQSIEDKRYFYSRGIAIDLINKYKLCILHDKDGKRAVLPIWINGEVVSYTARALDGQEPRYKNAVGKLSLFNKDHIHQEENVPIFITEGIFDALALEQRGYKAIALGGLEHASKLLEEIQKTQAEKNTIFLTAFDNDEAGKEAAARLPFKRLEIPSQYKDINEWHLGDMKVAAEGNTGVIMLKESIEQQLKTAAQPDAVSDYLNSGFLKDIDKFLTHKNKKTGFDNLDKEMSGVYAGLYVIGGISSVGKTTFVHQLGDQLAEQGDHVLYFSLEQSRLEMVSKSLSRMTARINLNDAVSSIQIRTGWKSEAVTKAIDKYRETAHRVSVIEGNFNTNIVTIRKYVDDYIKFNQVRPTVIVDYLQIMPTFNEKMNDKQKIDTNVTELKRISRDYDIPVFVISSLNRGNYLTPIDFESYKESGGIEYTADVVWGLQLEIMNDDIFNKERNIKEKREKVREAKSADPRQIELVCLKNRNGKPSFSCTFTYWPKYDFYESNIGQSINKDFSLNYSKTELTRKRKKL